ncbi:ankyrin repeat domain-containing protein [bacterium]|nr:ankyrin repeat domain-containing protein [bacterium]
MKRVIIVVFLLVIITFPVHSVTGKDFINECKNGNKEMVARMIKNGADVNAVDILKWTPLHWAVFRGHLEVVELLIDKGCNVNAAAKNGSTPLNLVGQNTKNTANKVLDTDKIEKLLKKNGAIVNSSPFSPRGYSKPVWQSKSSSRTVTYGSSNRKTFVRYRNKLQGLKLISIVGNANRRMAMIECNGIVDDYCKGDIKAGKFKVVDILADSVIVYSLVTRRQLTIKLPF